MTFQLSRAALSELADIADYITVESSPDRAELVIREIFKAAELLSETPGIGHSRPDLTDEPVLVWPVYDYLMFYDPDERPVRLITVIHGARSPRSIRDALRRPETHE